MKKATLVFACMFAATSLFSQDRWNFLVYGEETFHNGDIRSSYSVFLPENLANNGGIRMGAYKNLNEYWSTELTVGLSSTSGEGRKFQTKFLPVEALFNYNLLSSSVSELAKTSRLNAGLGLGSSYAQLLSETANANRSWTFEEFVTAALTYDFKLTSNSHMNLGYRHSFFLSDYIDGNASQSLLRDNMSRFCIGFRVDLMSQGGGASADALADAEQRALEIAQQLEAANAQSSMLARKVQEQKAELDRQRAALAQAEQDLLATEEAPKETAPQAPIQKKSGFAVIVSSFKEEFAAKEMASTIPGAVVIPVPQLGYFRVAGAIEPSYSAAAAAAQRFQDQGLDTWIIQL